LEAEQNDDYSSQNSSASKDYIHLKQQLQATENELIKKTALFEEECRFFEKKVQEANKEIESLKETKSNQSDKYLSK